MKKKKKREGGFKKTNLKKFLIIVPGLSLTLVSDEVAVVVTTVLAVGLTVFEWNHREKLQIKRTHNQIQKRNEIKIIGKKWNWAGQSLESLFWKVLLELILDVRIELKKKHDFPNGHYTCVWADWPKTARWAAIGPKWPLSSARRGILFPTDYNRHENDNKFQVISIHIRWLKSKRKKSLKG